MQTERLIGVVLEKQFANAAIAVIAIEIASELALAFESRQSVMNF